MMIQETKPNEKQFNKIFDSLMFFESENIYFVEVGPFHFRYEQWDFWPTTGKYFDRLRGNKGRGHKRLLKNIKKVKNSKDDFEYNFY